MAMMETRGSDEQAISVDGGKEGTVPGNRHCTQEMRQEVCCSLTQRTKLGGWKIGLWTETPSPSLSRTFKPIRTTTTFSYCIRIIIPPSLKSPPQNFLGAKMVIKNLKVSRDSSSDEREEPDDKSWLETKEAKSSRKCAQAWGLVLLFWLSFPYFKLKGGV